MVTRRYGREWALQLLVQFDLAAPDSLPAAIAAFWEQQAQLEAEDLEEDKRNAKVIFTSTDPKVLAELADIRAFTEEQHKVCAQIERTTREQAEAMLRETEERCRAREREADAYWEKLSAKFEQFCAEHKELRELLDEGRKS